ncbi:MAG: GNAT family N-acetyltransferase [Candidatus Berkelbacteria bacterium]
MTKLIKAKIEDKELLSNLVEIYLGELNEFENKVKDKNGKFGYKYLDLYWEETNRHPFLIKVGDELAGFILINLDDPESNEKNIHTIAEFFIIKKFRNKGVGKESARMIFEMFPGKWVVRQLAENKIGQLFWQKIISDYSNGKFKEETEEKGPILKFSN